MSDDTPKNPSWRRKLVSPELALKRLEPGMSIFLSAGPAEPRTLVQALMGLERGNLQDLELIQVVSVGDALTLDALQEQKYRLKTFFAGYLASDAITHGQVDLIPSRLAEVPRLIDRGAVRIDAAFVQITTPDAEGWASLGLGLHASRSALEKASLVVGEINPEVPWTLGDTLVHVDDLDLLVESKLPPFSFPRWPRIEVFERVARQVAALIEDASCLHFAVGPMFEALAPALADKRDLGLHVTLVTDAVRELIQSGAVTNRRKRLFRGKTLASGAVGTPELYAWLDRNPRIELQDIDITAHPQLMGRNDRFIALLEARRVDLTGRLALPTGRGNVAAGPERAHDLFVGARLSKGGKTIVALPSRNRRGEPKIVLSVEAEPGKFPYRESLDFIVTEYGAAYLTGRTVRERAQALIDIAHPDDREALVRQAKDAHILYPDQVYLPDFGHLYPDEVATTRTFKGDLTVRFRALRPSDEEEMRRLFYRFSDRAVYYRFFAPVKAMPHAKMQDYVNIDFRQAMSIVGLVGNPGEGEIVAEARWIRAPHGNWADVAFIVDEEYQGKGLATFLFQYLIQLARERGIEGLTADVLATNKAMMVVFERSPYPLEARFDEGVYELTIPFRKPEDGPAK